MTDEKGSPAALASPEPAEGDRFFGLSLDLLCITGPDGYFKRLNPAWERTFGFSLEELLARPVMELVHPDDRTRTRAAGASLRNGEDIVRFESRHLCKNGSFRWISWTCGAMQAGDPFLYAVGRDVTDRRVAEERLDRKTAELEAVFRALPDLLFRVDGAGRIVDYSAGKAADLYAAPDAFLGKRFSDVLPAAVGEVLDQSIAEAHRTGAVASVEYELAVPSGKQRFEARVVPFLEGHCITVVRNVTDRWLAQEQLQRSEERLRESEKLEAVGRLAGGIAHDFNNLMMAVLTYSEMLLRRLPAGDPQRRELLEIRGAGERATRLTRQLLAFARRQFLQPTVLDPGTIVRDLEAMLRDVIGEHIALTSSCAAGLWSVRVDRSQLEQVVLNLALNARDAMPAGGFLELSAENATVDEEDARRLDLPRAGDYVRLSVADTGCGIAADALPHLFEPFFTTKGLGSGTGLGLATVYGVVGQSGGSVAVESKEGEGATFTLYLPRALEKPEPVSAPEPSEPRRGDETVLVVEDEAAVRRAIVDTLRPLGYHVLEAENGHVALALAKAHEGGINLLLTDVVMPGMGGYELAARLRAAQRGVEVLFMSGYVSSASGDASAEAKGAMLQKPFTPCTLAHGVREALDARVRASRP